MKQFVLPLFIIGLVYTTPVAGQMRMQQSQPEQVSRFLHLEPVSLPSDDSTLSRVDVLYRIDADFFVPVKNSDTTLTWGFMRRGEFIVELLDSTGGSRARNLERIEIGENSPERSPDKKSWFEGAVSFNIPPGNYTILAQADDLESKRSLIERNTKITAAIFDRNSLRISTPFFIRDSAGTSLPARIIPENMAGDLLFGVPGSVVVEVVPAITSDAPVTVECSITPDPKTSTDDTKHAPILTGKANAQPAKLLKPLKEGAVATYELNLQSAGHCRVARVPLDFQRLPLRQYELTVTARQGTMEQVVTRRFQLVWPEMPRSLRDVDYAIDALRFIVTEAKLDSLKEGKWETRRDNLEAFWRSRNPPSLNAYSEVMTQYYRRMDYAAKTFGTLRQIDGSKTDRGRIFILYGPPSRTERTLSPAQGYKEVWFFDRLSKKLVFVDENKSGNYVLLSTTE